jgi:hypothetical protein
VACSGRLEFELGKNRWAYGPQNASYNSESISARVEGVKTYFLEPGIVSSANRRRAKGSLVRSRGFTEPRNLVGNSRDDSPDISGMSQVFVKVVQDESGSKDAGKDFCCLLLVRFDH